MGIVRRVVDDPSKTRWYRLLVVWEFFVLSALGVFMLFICFWGRPPHLPVLLLGSESRVRYEAQFSFKYESKEKQGQERELARLRTAPVYRVAVEESLPVLVKYRNFIRIVSENFDELRTHTGEERKNACLRLIIEVNLPGLHQMLANDVSNLIELVPGKEAFTRLTTRSVEVLEQLLRSGIYMRQEEMRLYSTRAMEWTAASAALRENLYSVALKEPSLTQEHVEVREALYSLFSAGLRDNVHLDGVETQRQQELAMSKVQPVTVEVLVKDPLVQPGERVTPVVLERWNAYRQQLEKHGHSEYGVGLVITENSLPVLGLVVLVVLYMRVVLAPLPRKRRDMSLAAVLVLLNVGIIRIVLDLGESQDVLRVLERWGLPIGGEMLFWMAPPALAAILVTIFSGAPMAVLTSFIVSAASSLMLGRSTDVLFVSLVASLVGIWFSRGVRNRGMIMRAGFASGIAVTVPAFFLCLSGGVAWQGLALQAVGCMAGGLLTGVFAAEVLPLLERLFKITTNITLLSLTDYNHPLLRKLQITAPGTFHHSVMVSDLAERAATEIGANSLLCRCSALYHDVGKMVKPEYFIENQRMGANPHAEVSPTTSALVIKSHVREGVVIAREYKLPRVIIDVIEQHHGTGLIRYFYHKAKQNADAAASGENTVDEVTFRYDGPRPRTKESAIVLFADSLEAASRSLKKVTPVTIKDLVEAIVAERIMDGQLDTCPLTFREVQGIRQSLKSSLLNMLHHRVEYPKSTYTAAEPSVETEADKKTAPAATGTQDNAGSADK
ncbi:MAG: HDIG domain-containing protein [Puniceicoccales bacterium]|nr:HDIG domain-containing protein [Puniceicoccales bacterium]